MKHAWILLLALAGCSKPCNPSGKPVPIISASIRPPTLAREGLYTHTWFVQLQDQRYCEGRVDRQIILVPGNSYKLENFTEIPT